MYPYNIKINAFRYIFFSFKCFFFLCHSFSDSLGNVVSKMSQIRSPQEKYSIIKTQWTDFLNYSIFYPYVFTYYL